MLAGAITEKKGGVTMLNWTTVITNIAEAIQNKDIETYTKTIEEALANLPKHRTAHCELGSDTDSIYVKLCGYSVRFKKDRIESYDSLDKCFLNCEETYCIKTVLPISDRTAFIYLDENYRIEVPSDEAIEAILNITNRAIKEC